MNKNNSGKNTTPSTAANTAAAAINYHYIQKDVRIWVESQLPKTYIDEKEEPYFLATVNKLDEKKLEAEVKYVSVNRPVEVVKFDKTMQFVNELDINLTDMAAAEDINEVDLLNCLKNRFFKKILHTNVGSTLIIMNPYQRVDGNYGEDILDNFLDYFKTLKIDDRKEIENPHLYDLTLTAIRRLTDNRKNQAIVISGESGAGKTEAAKNSMKCITYYFGKQEGKKMNDGKPSLEDQILGCNPILEAFGNSKTVRNDNSSRFGKYVTINLDVITGKIEGAQIQTYLLEKSRVCEPNEGERNYHIFYHLLKGPPDLLKQLYLVSDPSFYKFLSVTKCFEVPTVNDVKLYQETLDAFKVTGFSDLEIMAIWKTVAAVLLLGNLNFKETGEAAQVEDKALFGNICSLLDVSPETLEISLTVNVRNIQGQELRKPLRMAEAFTYRNAFTKELYNRLFNWLVKKLNKQLAPNINMSDPNKKYIGLLDIFGFECFTFNSIEQMCINFTNEKLQQLYINDVFKAELNEYIREGLKDYLGEIAFKDNQAIIDCMDKAGSGIFQILDDKAMQNKPDEDFFSAIAKLHEKNPVFKVAKLVKTKFTLIHTAKDVEYSITGFVSKNLDEVKQTMVDCMMASKNNVIKYIFSAVVDETEFQAEMKYIEDEKNSKGAKKDSKYLGGKFRNEMLKLMGELSGCECHYVRCLKPNELKKKEFFVPTFVFQQIRYLGILDTIRVRKDGYPIRKKFRDFFMRFEEVCFFPEKKSIFEYQKITDDAYFKDLAIKCLDQMVPNKSTKDVLVGLTKIMTKQAFNSKLERNRTEKMKKKEDASAKISKNWKMSKKRKFFLSLKKKTKYLQKFYRTKKGYIKTQKLRSCCRKIQKNFRGLLMRRKHKYRIKRYLKLQSCIRSFLTRKRIKMMKKSVRFLIGFIRIFLNKAFKQRKNKIKKVVLSIFDRAWNIILIKYKQFASIRIQAQVRCYLAKVRNWNKVKKGRYKREMFLQDKAATVIQRISRGHYVRKVIKMSHESAFKIQGFWKILKLTALIHEMRAKTLILQRNVRMYLLRKNVIDRRLGEYFKDEIQSLDKLLFDSSKVLFPNLLKIHDEEATDFFEDMSNHSEVLDMGKKNYKASLPEYNAYGEPRISVFAKIVDFDIIFDCNEIYDNIWAREFEKIFNTNINNNSPLQIISSGSCHTITLNSKGKLFSWGWNNYGQCGIPLYSTYSQMIIPELRRDRKGNIPAVPVLNYHSAKQISSDDFGNVKQIVCGEDHTFIIDDNCNAWACGSNNKGQLGLGNAWDVEKPTLIADLKGRVKEIRTSGDVSFAITIENDLYVWPFENAKQNYKPLRLYMDKKITILTISCGKNFVMILSKQGILYSFGKSNKKGELGVGDLKPRSVPEPIYTLADSGDRITQVSCGFKHTIAKSTNGKVFTWGYNGDGQLGIGNYYDKNSPTQIHLEHIRITRTIIIQVSAGFRSCFLLTESRNILCCGTTGSLTKKKIPVKFDIKIRTPEVADENSFSVLRILNTWNKSFSIFYCSFGDVRIVANKLKNKPKLNTILNTLCSKWESDSLDAPYIESISAYFYPSFMKKVKEEKKVERKNEKMMKEYMKKII